MISKKRETPEDALDRFVEGLFRLMMEHHRNQVSEMSLTLLQAQALRLLGTEALTTSKLAAALGISAPAVTQLTDRLFSKNLIERRTHEADRRSVIVGLTNHGSKVIDGLRRRRNEAFGEALERLSDSDRDEVIDALDKVADVLEGDQAPATKRRPSPRAAPLRQRQAADQIAESSKEAGPVPAVRPQRRMKIEWD